MSCLYKGQTVHAGISDRPPIGEFRMRKGGFTRAASDGCRSRAPGHDTIHGYTQSPPRGDSAPCDSQDRFRAGIWGAGIGCPDGDSRSLIRRWPGPQAGLRGLPMSGPSAVNPNRPCHTDEDPTTHPALPVISADVLLTSWIRVAGPCVAQYLAVPVHHGDPDGVLVHVQADMLLLC